MDILGFEFFPSVGLKITNHCHMHCSFCCEPDRSIEDPDIENLCDILDRLWLAGTRRICYTGGEPLLYPQLDHLLRYGHDRGFFNVLLTADGKLLAERKSCLASADIVRISVHGQRSTHDLVLEIPGAFDDLSKAISEFHLPATQLAIATVVTPLNKSELLAIAEWALNKGIRFYYLFGLLMSGKGSHYANSYGYLTEDEFNAYVKEIRAKFGKTMEIRSHSYHQSGQCILVYSNGDIIVEPVKNGPTTQKKIGNIFVDNPEGIIRSLASDHELLADYLEKVNNSSAMAMFGNIK